MRKSIVWSAALHALVVVLAVLGLPRLWESASIEDQPTIVEMVNIDEKTTAKEQPKPEPKKQEPEKKKKPPPPPEPPKAKPTPAPPPPTPPRVEETPEPKAEKVPVKPKPEPKKVPEKKEEKKAEPKPTPPPKAVAKARPQRKPPEPKEDFLQSVLRDVSPEERVRQREEPKKQETKPAPAPEKQPQRQAELDAVATTSEIDAIRHAIEQCWNVPAGARDAENLVVAIRVWVNPDGMVRDARLDQDQARLNEPHFRTAAESAMRAVLNPRCQPLPIPPKKYDQFKNLVLEFNPRTAAGS